MNGGWLYILLPLSLLYNGSVASKSSFYQCLQFSKWSRECTLTVHVDTLQFHTRRCGDSPPCVIPSISQNAKHTMLRALAFDAQKWNIEDGTEGDRRQTLVVLLALSLSHPPLSRMWPGLFVIEFVSTNVTPRETLSVLPTHVIINSNECQMRVNFRPT